MGISLDAAVMMGEVYRLLVMLSGIGAGGLMVGSILGGLAGRRGNE